MHFIHSFPPQVSSSETSLVSEIMQDLPQLLSSVFPTHSVGQLLHKRYACIIATMADISATSKFDFLHSYLVGMPFNGIHFTYCTQNLSLHHSCIYEVLNK